MTAFYFWIRIDPNFKYLNYEGNYTVPLEILLQSCVKNFEKLPEMVFTYLFIAESQILKNPDIDRECYENMSVSERI